MKIKYTISDIKIALKPNDAWWTVLFIDPIAIRITWLIANLTKIKPNYITLFSFFIGLISACFFLQGEYFYLILGAIIFEISFIFDCVDGKLSKLTNRQSRLGQFLDYMLDRWRIFFNLFALIYGQYILHNANIFLILGFIYLFLAMCSLIQCFLQNMILKFPQKENEENNTKKITLFFKLKHLFKKNRLHFGITDIETDTLVIFIFPLLGLVKIGLLFGILVMFIWLIIMSVRFTSMIRKQII